MLNEMIVESGKLITAQLELYFYTGRELIIQCFPSRYLSTIWLLMFAGNAVILGVCCMLLKKASDRSKEYDARWLAACMFYGPYKQMYVMDDPLLRIADNKLVRKAKQMFEVHVRTEAKKASPLRTRIRNISGFMMQAGKLSCMGTVSVLGLIWILAEILPIPGSSGVFSGPLKVWGVEILAVLAVLYTEIGNIMDKTDLVSDLKETVVSFFPFGAASGDLFAGACIKAVAAVWTGMLASSAVITLLVLLPRVLHLAGRM